MTVAPTYWRLVLCDLAGNPLSILSTVATNKIFRFPLNRPATLSFSVPSDNPHVNILHTDHRPFLTVGCRTIKAYRRMTEESLWTLRYNGIVWSLQDVTDGNTCQTAVTCYDPMQLLTKRLIRKTSDGTFTNIVFPTTGVAALIKTFIDNTNNATYAGESGISTSLGVISTVLDQALNPVQYAPTYDKEYIATAIVDFTDTGNLDVWFDPLDRTDSKMVSLNIKSRRGSDKSTGAGRVTLAYAAPGASAFSLDRSVSMDNFANAIWLYSQNSAHVGVANPGDDGVKDTTSKGIYHVYEDAQVLTDVVDSGLTDALALEQLALRKDPQDLLTMLPIPEKAPIPWRDFFVGDTIQVQASIGYGQTFPLTRESIPRPSTNLTDPPATVQRVYGLTIEVDDNGVERVSGIDTSPQAGG